MIEKDRKIYLKLVNSLVGLKLRLECWISVVQAAASSGDDALDGLLDSLLVQLRGKVVHIKQLKVYKRIHKLYVDSSVFVVCA